MAYVYPGARYLDLFDDNLYTSHEDGFVEKNSDHLNNLRLQMLASLLFEGSIIVPEQWLVSSPNFCRLAAEITEPWLRRQKPGVLPRKEMRRPPIVPAFFETHEAHADTKLLCALKARLAEVGGSPVRLTPELDPEDPIVFNPNKRLVLRQELDRIISNPRVDRTNDRYFLENFYDILGDSAVSSAFFTLNKYLYFINQDFISFQQKDYNDALAFRVKAVAANAYHDGPSADINPDRHRAWKAFFEEARVNKIDVSQITALRQLISGPGFDHESRRSIQSIGRYCMHTSLAQMCQSELAATSYFLYEQTRPDEYDHSIISAIRSARDPSEKNVVVDLKNARLSPDSFECLYQRSAIRPPDFAMDWPTIWENFWDYKFSERWANDRAIIEHELLAADQEIGAWERKSWEGHQIDAWNRLFERLSDELRFIHFFRNPDDARYLRIAIKVTSSPKSLLDLSKKGTVIAAAFGLAAVVSPALSIPIMTIAGGALGCFALLGQGVDWALRSNEAKSAAQRGLERFFGSPQVIQKSGDETRS